MTGLTALGLFRRNFITSDSTSAIPRYYSGLRAACAKISQEYSESSFEPSFALPELDTTFEEYYSCSEIRRSALGARSGKTLGFLDLTLNPGTNTTKTFPSLVMVARAIQHLRGSNDSIVIVCPSSGNKAVGLRDAVLRAIRCKLVPPERLRIVSIIPRGNVDKLRRSALSDSPELARLNPVFSCPSGDGALAKAWGQEVAQSLNAEVASKRPMRAWYSLDLRNYKVADTVRAFFDFEQGALSRTVHAHAVSSAYGLLGYAYGRMLLAEAGVIEGDASPGYLLIQHLATCDMVLHSLYRDFDRSRLPQYTPDSDQHRWVQSEDPHFPFVCAGVEEVIDRTFYTRAPPTALEMSSLISRFGGSAIAVSLEECVARIGEIRTFLAKLFPSLGLAPTRYREWSLVMAITGVMNAIDRGLLDSFENVVIHGSGFYTDQDYVSLPDGAIVEVESVEDILKTIHAC